MISWIKAWAEGIIVAIIIATIIEMIIPEGTIKKYVKIVIGVYIMFNIIAPVINKFNGKEISFSIDNYENYYKQTNSYEELNKELSDTNDMQIEEVYINKLKSDIATKIKNKGYNVNSIELQINKDNSDEYGKILKLNVYITQNGIEIAKENTIEKVSIDKVSIDKDKDNIVKEAEEIGNSDELKEYLSSEYGIDINNIIINNK